MRVTVTLDEEMVKKAKALSGLQGTSALLREALKVVVERESARRLARLGGSSPNLEAPPRS